MNGLLVYNHFLTTNKYTEINEYLIKSANKKGVFITTISNVALMLTDIPRFIMERKISFALFFDKDVRLAELLENNGIRVFNSSEAIWSCDDKSLTYIKLMNKGIRMPKTIIVPKIYKNVEWKNEFDCIEMCYPIIVKECFGSFGEQVYKANSKEELIEIVNRNGTKPMILQEFIKSSYGRDLRIEVVGGKVIASMCRHSLNDFRANITNGAQMEKYEPNEMQKKMAIRVCEILGLDFAGIDILFGENDEPIFCEANSSAHFINLEKCTGINVADYIIDYIIEVVTNAK